MKFIHFSDTHLGYSELSKLNQETGLNQRELDVNDAFKQAIDYILETKPLFVLHAGDLFDTFHPLNRTISFAFNQLKRVSDANIPFVVIAGNHSTPRISASGSIFESIKVLKNIFPVNNREYEMIELDDFIIHAIPHCSTEQDMEVNVNKAKIIPHKKNILMTHAGIVNSEYKTGEFNEQKIPRDVIKDHNFDYIALGHYHTFSHVGKNAYYSGSTERLGIKYAGKTMGILEVPVDTFQPKLIPLKNRPMIDLDIIDANGKDLNQILNEIYSQGAKIDNEAVVRVNIINLQRNIYVQLNRAEIEEKLSNAFNIELNCEIVSIHSGPSVKTTLDDLETEFQRYIDSRSESDEDKKEMVDLAKQYLDKAESLHTYDN